MNKIVIVGHPASGTEEVLALLQKCGMAAALPSRRDGLLPEAITAALCKAHKLPPLESVIDEAEFSQIEVAPVWQGMALDLMLGNLEQPLWGWADPQTIYVLDYWEELDPQLTFVLVYDEPHRVLMEAVRRQEGGDNSPSKQDLGHLLDNWVAYNGALLRFHLRHTGRSLLVHSQQVHRATDRYVEQLQPLLNTQLLPSDEATALPEVEEGSPSLALVPLAQDLSLALSAVGLEPGRAISLLQADRAEHYIIDDLLGHYPAVMQVYAELQSIANLPLDAPPREAEGIAAAAWEALLRQRDLASQVMVRLHGEVLRAGDEVAHGKQALQDERADAANALAKAQQEVLRSHGQSKQLQVEAASQAKKLRSAGEENELLLGQLHKVQEELERHYLRLQEMERAKESADKALELLQAEVKQSAEQADKLKSAGEENELLLDQLHRANEELERYYLRLAAIERGKASSDEALGSARREIDTLKFQFQEVQAELQDWSTRAPDLSIVTSRRLLSTAMRRLVKKVLPESLLRLTGRGRARRDLSETRELEHDLEQIRQSPWFNADWYLGTYQDVKQAGMEAVTHYHVHGWKEGRKPGPNFDSAHYLTAYPDVRQADVDPLLHFIRHGASEGRLPTGGANSSGSQHQAR